MSGLVTEPTGRDGKPEELRGIQSRNSYGGAGLAMPDLAVPAP
jgi:hypothetical protein